MKKILILFLLFPFVIFSQSQTENYTETKIYKEPTNMPVSGHDKNKVMTTIQYFDGLGRLKQTIGVEAGGSLVSDNVMPIDWQLNNTTTAFYNRNGGIAENKIINGTTPFGNTDLLWECIPDAGSNADGGWNTDYFTIDNTKTYRYTIWVKKNKVGANNLGRTWHGTQNVNDLSGAENSNPYFWVGHLPKANTWYLLVGVVHPHSYTGGNTGVSGVYDSNGNKVLGGTEFKWRPGVYQTRFRSYLYYSTDTSVRQYFWSPLTQTIDGSELSIQDIIRSNSALVTAEKANDIVTHAAYDNLGRQVKEYLPFASQSNNANIRTGDVELETQKYYQQKYEDDFAGVAFPTVVNAYTEKAFDGSPLNRVMKQAAPGKDWKLGNGHEIQFGYQTNGASEVRIYNVTTNFANNTYTPTLQGGNTYYAVGELSKTITKDENWTSGLDHTTEEFKNKQGQVVLKRAYNSGQKYDTYYVYDDFGNLTYVLPPKAEGTISRPTTTKLNELCYQYKYDIRNRLVEEKIPGKGWEYIVYDKLDRPVLTQDIVQRPSKWLFTKYDQLGRVAYTGQYSDVNTRVGMQEFVYDETGIYHERQTTLRSSTTGLYYSNDAVPFEITSSDIYVVNYYDRYVDLPSGLGVTVTTSYGQTSTIRTKSLATVNKTRVLGTNYWITSVSYYDEKARPIYIYSKNDYLQTVDIVEHNLDEFTGKILETKTTHKKAGKADVVTTDRFEYDHMDRLVSQTQQVNNQTSERIVKNNYDDLGQLTSKIVGNGTQAGYKDITSGLTVSNNEITKVGGGGWAVGLATQGSFSGNGYVEFIAGSDNTPMMIGLSNSNNNAHYNTINHAIYLYWTKRLLIYENGSNKGEYGKFEIGDVFRVERIGNTIHYKRNGETFYISKTPSTGSLLGDISMHTNGAKIKDFKIVDNHKGLQKIDYKYNVRGWLTSINDDAVDDNDLFNFSLRYNTGSDPTKRLYNGNIAQTSSQTQNIDASTRAYTYSYDALNRITAATGTLNNRYNVGGITYDKNGNILNLIRKGHVNETATSFGTMDDLAYTYDSGNKLLKVAERTGSTTYGFKDGTNTGNDYSYDGNGNMKTDANKGVTSITYNHLDLPIKVTKDNGTIEYVYDATGIKLSKKITPNSAGSGSITYYAGNYKYLSDRSGERLEFFNHSEGYVANNNGDFSYIYQFKDHLDNIRLSYTDGNKDGKIETPTTQVFYDNLSSSAGWNSIGALHGSSATIDDKHAISGAKSAKLSRNGSGEVFAHNNQWVTINNTAATDYVFSGWIYVEAPSSAYGRIIMFMNENGETGYATQIAEAPRVRETNKWVYVEQRVTVPANIDKINLRIDIYTGGSKVEGWFDDLRISKVNASGNEIVEESNYYPFGLRHKGYNNSSSSSGNSIAQKFGYNSVELEEALGINLMEMDVRSYDPAIARWTGIDPVTHYNFSTYNAFDNNPVFWADPSGADAIEVKGGITYVGQDAIRAFNIIKDNLSTKNNDDDDNPFRRELRKICPECLPQSNSVQVLDIANYLGGLKQSYNRGIYDWVADKMDFFKNKISSFSFWKGKVNQTVDDIENGRSILNIGPEYAYDIIDNVTSMSLNDWAYAAGYSSPSFAISSLGGFISGNISFSGSISLRGAFSGGKTFRQYKVSRGGGGLVGEIPLNSPHRYYGNSFPVRVEYSHRWITQRTQSRLSLPNWLVNNRLNVYKTNTLRHAGHDKFRYRFLPREIKDRLGPGGDLNFNMFDK